MSVLSIDYSRGSSTAVLVNDDLSYKIAKFPLLMPKINFYNKPANTEVFSFLLKQIEERFKTKIYKKMPIYVGQFEDYKIELPEVKFCMKDDSFKSLYPLDFTYFGHLNVGSSSGFYNREIELNEIVKELFFEERAEVLENHFENINLYPFVQANSDRDYYEEDTCLKYVVKRHCDYLRNAPTESLKTILFSTIRNLDNESRLCRFMLLCIEALCSPGFYKLKLDFKNYIGAISALSYFDNALYQKLEVPSYFELGSLVNIPEDISCTIVKGGAVVQEFKVVKGEIFSLPLHFLDNIELVVKSHKWGELKKTLSGGAFGIVFDTREKSSTPSTLPVEKRKILMEKWEEELIERLKGF